MSECLRARAIFELRWKGGFFRLVLICSSSAAVVAFRSLKRGGAEGWIWIEDKSVVVGGVKHSMRRDGFRKFNFSNNKRIKH